MASSDNNIRKIETHYSLCGRLFICIMCEFLVENGREIGRTSLSSNIYKTRSRNFFLFTHTHLPAKETLKLGQLYLLSPIKLYFSFIVH